MGRDNIWDQDHPRFTRCSLSEAKDYVDRSLGRKEVSILLESDSVAEEMARRLESVGIRCIVTTV